MAEVTPWRKLLFGKSSLEMNLRGIGWEKRWMQVLVDVRVVDSTETVRCMYVSFGVRRI